MNVVDYWFSLYCSELTDNTYKRLLTSRVVLDEQVL